MKRWRNTAKAFIATLFLLLGTYWFLDRGDGPQTASASLDRTSTDVLVQQFQIDEGGVNVKLQSRISTIQRNAWFGVEFFIEDSDGQEIYDKYVEFWHEFGRDSDGPWSEDDLSSNWYVRFDEPGTYQLLASADVNSTAQNVDLKLTSERGKVALIPFVAAGFVAMLLMMLSRGKSSSLASAAASIALKLGPRRSGAKTNSPSVSPLTNDGQGR